MDKNNLIKLDHKITYHDPHLHEKFKITDEKEKEDLHDVIYKYDLLIYDKFQYKTQHMNRY